VALEINDEVVPVVFETSGSDDGIQEETAKMMVCSTRYCASCNSEEMRLELVDAAVLSWAQIKAMPGEVSRTQCSY
jgi:hypothetical protein